MNEFILEAVFLPVALSTILFLLPRLPWSVEKKQRVDIWSAAPAFAVATILSLYFTEGAEIWNLNQKWYSLWVTALIVGFGGMASCALSKDHWKPYLNTPMKSELSILTGTSAFAIFALQFPNHEGIVTRIILAAIAAITTRLMIGISRRTPIAMPLTLSISFATIAILLLFSGSIKVALTASSLSLASGICAILAFWCKGFSGGASFTMAGITLAFALALYGTSYHNPPALATTSWCVACLAPILLFVANHFRHSYSSMIAIVIILIVCGTIVFEAWCATQPQNKTSDNSTPYTSKNDERTFSDYSASSI